MGTVPSTRLSPRNPRCPSRRSPRTITRPLTRGPPRRSPSWGNGPLTAASNWLHSLWASKGRLLHDQHRNAFYLVLGNLIAAATGLLFWLLLARVMHLPASEIGIGYAIVGMGATIAIVAKGGLDTALLRTVPSAHPVAAVALWRLGMVVGSLAAILLTVLVGVGAFLLHALPLIGPLGWALVCTIAVLLVITWLQDAYHLAEGNARFGVQRNLVLSIARIALPIPVLALAWYQPVATAWLIALAASALVALVVRPRASTRTGTYVSWREFLRRSWRNEASSAFEFLPGLLLAPIVLMVDGASAAGHFAIVWAAASLLFVLSAAIGRGALAEMVRKGPLGVAAAIRKATWHHLLFLGPAALLGIVLSKAVLGIFGAQYALEGATTFAILCASIVFVAPSYMYLSVLRSADRTGPLVAFPALMLIVLVILTPILGGRFGLPGVGAAWLLANAPFGLFAAWRLRYHIGEVSPRSPIPGRSPVVE